jgi:hypothetical protein
LDYEMEIEIEPEMENIDLKGYYFLKVLKLA